MDPDELKRFIDNEFAKGNCIVAFLDILGFKEHVKKYINPEDTPDMEILEKIKSCLSDSFKIIEQDLNQHNKLLRIKVFSDCTCASIPEMLCMPTEASMLCLLITWVVSYNYNLIRRDIYPRGGISFGFHYEDENMIFSDGLIKAHELENEKAIYPRTILDEELINRLKWYWMNQRDTIELFGTNKKIIIDEEGIVFINPFNLVQSTNKWTYKNIENQFKNEKDFKEYLLTIDNNYNNEILKNLELKIQKFKNDEHILIKYSWLKDLLNWNMDPKLSGRKFEYLLK